MSDWETSSDDTSGSEATSDDGSGSETISDDLSDVELKERLSDYFKYGVDVPWSEKRNSSNALMWYVRALSQGLNSDGAFQRLRLCVGRPIFYGRIWTDQNFQRTYKHEEFDLRFPLQLDNEFWITHQTDDRRCKYRSYECSPTCEDVSADVIRLYGKMDRGSCTLDPLLIWKKFQDELVTQLQLLPRDRYPVTNWQRDNAPGVLIFEAEDRRDAERTILVNVCALLQMKNSQNDICHLLPLSSRFVRSFADKGHRLIESKDRGDGGCRLMLIRILSSLAAEEGSPLSPLNSCIFMYAALQNVDAWNWQKDNVSRCFRSLLRYLGRCCRERLLPRYFEPSANFLADYPEEDLDNVCNALHEIDSYGTYATFFM